MKVKHTECLTFLLFNLIPMFRTRITVILAVILIAGCSRGSLEDGFRIPPQEYRPWCYWWWLGGNVDTGTIDSDLERMKDLGFGGFLLVDSRGYWDDDDDHVRAPQAQCGFMSDEWVDNVCRAIRKADTLGLEVGINLSSSGGSFKGPWPLGEDSPKELVFRRYLPGGPFEEPDLPFYKDIAAFAIRTSVPLKPTQWQRKAEGGRIEALEVTQIDAAQWQAPAEGHWTVLRLGYATIPGHETDVDIIDPGAVRRHIARMVDPLKERVGDLFGTTLTHFYSVSWEGAIPTWSGGFESDFRRYEGYDIRPCLPLLAGFSIPGGPDAESFAKDFVQARNNMFRDNFYKTMRDCCHDYGLSMFSECGGPWSRKQDIFRWADQQEFLSLNDMPQGEFWYDHDHLWHLRGVSAAAHAYGKPRASAEAFTTMRLHWSEYPAVLKPYADSAFVDGINHLVWHTFTCSPEKFGVPGAEYFAGTHLNGNVTWCKDAAPFIEYLARCQYMLQQGEPVVDIAVAGGSDVYQHFGHYSRFLQDTSAFRVPPGYNADLLGADAVRSGSELQDGRFVLGSGMEYRMLVNDSDADAAPGFPPDCESEGLAFVHRRTPHEDIYFIIGSGHHALTLRCLGVPSLWDPVSGGILPLPYEATADGRTRLEVDLPGNGSAFIVVRKGRDGEFSPAPDRRQGPAREIAGPWEVSFKYHDGIAAVPPSPRRWDSLEDLTADQDPQVRYFSGDVTLRTEFVTERSGRALIDLGCVTGGLCRVSVNGQDCGVVWTAPWRVEADLKDGVNEIEIRFTNTWRNRLIGDCRGPAEEQVTVSNLHYFRGARVPWRKETKPTFYSGYAASDSLQNCGVTGPVRVSASFKTKRFRTGIWTPRLRGPRT